MRTQQEILARLQLLRSLKAQELAKVSVDQEVFSAPNDLIMDLERIIAELEWVLGPEGPEAVS